MDTFIDNIYFWQNKYIIFLNNNTFNGSFGTGNYIKLNSNKINITINNKKYSIIFNDRYSEFIATRRDNGSITTGILLTFLNKTYSWLNDSIEFLYNGQIYGSSGLLGVYTKLQTNKLSAVINKKRYILLFDNTYTHSEFKATQIDNGEVTTGFLKLNMLSK